MALVTQHSRILLVTLTCLTVTQAQYYDFFQGLQQFFQPYQQPKDYPSQYADPSRSTDVGREMYTYEQTKPYDRHTKTPPINQYEYTFSTTLKPTRKSPRPNSSQTNKESSNRNFNSDFYVPTFDVTTKRARVRPNNRKTTTFKPTTTTTMYDYFKNRDPNNYGRVKPDIVFPNNNYENVNRPINSDRNMDYNNYNTVVSNKRNPDVQNINLNSDLNFDQHNNDRYDHRPSNNQNPIVDINNRDTDSNRNYFTPTTSSFNNRSPNNFKRGSTFTNNINRGVLNTDFDDNPGIPLINQPGVRPAHVDVNQPPITNKPVSDRNNFDYRPQGFDAQTDRPSDNPDIMIGPDDDDMSDGEKRRYINMAERMCDRYKSLSVKEVVALPLLPSPEPVEFNVSSCVPIGVPLVIGGKVATIHEFPHMALVGWRKLRVGGYAWKCGGSLISDRYILTAGHCTYQDKDYDADSGPPQAVQLGSSTLDDPGALVVKISSVIRHPKYKQRRSYYDIALIKLSQTITFSEVIRPACLGTPPRVGENIIATGWGRTEFGGDHSAELRTVSLPVWDMRECREIWGTSLKLPNGPSPDNQICAGEKNGGKDTCQGDSGGPAQIQDGCVWRVVAVTSFGRSCGAPNTPALYAIAQRAFIAAQVFGETGSSGNNGRRNENNNDRTPSLNHRQDFGTRRQETPSFTNRQRDYDNYRPLYSG